jgi:hypothetical protein
MKNGRSLATGLGLAWAPVSHPDAQGTDHTFLLEHVAFPNDQSIATLSPSNAGDTPVGSSASSPA